MCEVLSADKGLSVVSPPRKLDDRARLRLIVVCEYWPSRTNPISGVFLVQQVAAILTKASFVTVIVPKIVGKPQEYCSVAELGLDEARVVVIEVLTARIPGSLAFMPGFLRLNAIFSGLAVAFKLREISRVEDINGCLVHDSRYASLSLPFWRRFVRGKVVTVMHGVDPYFGSVRRRRSAKSQFRQLGGLTDFVALVGSPLRGYATSLGLPEKKMRVVANGTDLPPRAVASDGQRPSSARRRIVSVCNLNEIKGIDDNLLALRALSTRRPDLAWEYRVVGDGAQRESLESLSVSLGLSDRVTFVGRIPYLETMSEISDCDIFCLASWGEAFGIVYLEAMARMRPVIGCLENGPADFITSGHDGLLVPPRSTAALAEALECLIEDPGKCQRLGREARNTAEKFSWDTNAELMLDLLAD